MLQKTCIAAALVWIALAGLLAAQQDKNQIPRRSRRGYYAVNSLTPFGGAAEEQMAKALYNPELLDEIHTSILPAVFLDPAGDSLARVSLLIDSAGMPLTKVGADYSASFRVLAAAFDDKGKRESRQDHWFNRMDASRNPVALILTFFSS